MNIICTRCAATFRKRPKMAGKKTYLKSKKLPSFAAMAGGDGVKPPPLSCDTFAIVGDAGNPTVSCVVSRSSSACAASPQTHSRALMMPPRSSEKTAIDPTPRCMRQVHENPTQSAHESAGAGGKRVRARASVCDRACDGAGRVTAQVVRFTRGEHGEGSVLKCQYIEIPQSRKTHAVILSRPAWLWGAEMGANEHGVCIGNEAVHSRLSRECDDGVSRLLGMDLVRLGLERGATAKEALDVMTILLEKFGQGGSCEEGGDWCYENGFLICDASEAYVLETAGVHYWAAERVAPGKRRNISNGLSIRAPSSTHPKLKDVCLSKKWWDGQADFDWKGVIGSGGLASANLEPDGRERAGMEWLAKMPASPDFSDMAACLRDTESGICMQVCHVRRRIHTCMSY